MRQTGRKIKTPEGLCPCCPFRQYVIRIVEWSYLFLTCFRVAHAKEIDRRDGCVAAGGSPGACSHLRPALFVEFNLGWKPRLQQTWSDRIQTSDEESVPRLGHEFQSKCNLSSELWRLRCLHLQYALGDGG